MMSAKKGRKRSRTGRVPSVAGGRPSVEARTSACRPIFSVCVCKGEREIVCEKNCDLRLGRR